MLTKTTLTWFFSFTKKNVLEKSIIMNVSEINVQNICILKYL